MSAFNFFRILGDFSHLLSKLILIFAIHRNRSAEGVSLITQVLYALVFCTRYTDLFRETYKWNYFFKIFYILSSFYIIGVMRWVFPRTREKELAWKMGAIVLGGSLVLSPFVMLIFERGHYSVFFWLWDFSQVLESVCVLPQLLLLRQTTVPTVIDSFYLLTLGSYRGFYILNWIWRGLDSNDRKPNPVSVIFGVIQTALYLDFAWVYWTRQRVKLRNGGIVDADDIRRGWLLSRIFGKHVVGEPDEGEDEESSPALGGAGAAGGLRGAAPRAKWGKRGISISADEGMLDHEGGPSRGIGGGDDEDDEEHGLVAGVDGGAVDPDAKLQDPDELARALEDDDDDEDATLPSASQPPQPSGVRSGEEWRD